MTPFLKIIVIFGFLFAFIDAHLAMAVISMGGLLFAGHLRSK